MTPQIFPIFRIYHKPSNSFLTNGVLTHNNQYVVTGLTGAIIPLEGVHVDMFTFKLAEDATPIYQNDVVEISTPNEFGSVTLGRGIVRYNSNNLCYIIIAEGTQQIPTQPIPTNVVRVIGHNHDIV